MKGIHVFNLIFRNLILLKDWLLKNKALGYIYHAYGQSLVCLGVLSVKMADWVVCVVRPLTGFVLLLIRESEEEAAAGGRKVERGYRVKRDSHHRPANLLAEPRSREGVFNERTESLEMMFLMGTNAVSQVCQLVDEVTILCIPPPSNPRLLGPCTRFY